MQLPVQSGQMRTFCSRTSGLSGIPHQDFLPSALDSNQICCLVAKDQAPAGLCDFSPSPPVETFTPPREQQQS